MVQSSRKLFAVAFFIVAIGAVQRAAAWQGPDDLPQAPRLTEDQPVPPPIPEIPPADSLEQGGLPVVGNAPRTPAPAIIPVEEIIAQPAIIEPTTIRTPRSDVAIEPAEPTPADRPKQRKIVTKLKATTFQQVEPGATTMAELLELWGAPARQMKNETSSTLTFTVDPFPHVEANIDNDIVQSIVIYFDTPVSLAEVASSLGIDALNPAELFGNAGRPLEQIYPERGLTCRFTHDESAEKIASIRLEPLSAGAFMQRVQRDREQQWNQQLADLEIAATLNPDDERIHWLTAEVLIQQSEFRAAAFEIEKAMLTLPNSSLFQLTAARLIAEAGNYDDAISATTAVYRAQGLPALLKARAALQLGDLLATSPRHDFAKSLALHQHAIEMALPLATHEQGDLRSAAKRLLIDAHAAVASDIAQGKWQNKGASVQQWMDRGDALADEYIEHEHGSLAVKFEILCKRLDAYAWLEGKIDPASEIDRLKQLAEELTVESQDATFRRHLNWQYGKAMIDATDIERARGNPVKALEHGATAERRLSDLADSQWNNEKTHFQLSRLYFLLGSVQAVQMEDHVTAVKWFDKCLEDVSRPEPDPDLALAARRGQWLISMGISYWSVDRKQEGLRLTEVGVRLVDAARAGGKIDQQLLVVPYNNLAFMHKQLGNDEEAQQFAEMATKLKPAVQR